MKKFIFDFDGTLVDSMPTYMQVMLHILEKRNISYPEDLIRIITPLGLPGTAAYYTRNFLPELTPEDIIREMGEGLYYEYVNHIPAKETVKETMLALKELGYEINVLTASPHMTLDPCLKRVGLYDLFEHVWSCDDFSTTKSDVKIYSMVAERLKTTVDNCIFLDDNINALSTAKQAGMPVIGVHDLTSEEDKERIAALCGGKYVNRMDELLEYL